MQRWRRATGLSLTLFFVGCSHPLAEPPSGAHQNEEPVVVPYPPPAAKVDVIPETPDGMKNAVWIDGQWMWRGRRWVWEGGQWIDLATDQVYARPLVQRRYDGQLIWFPGAFRNATAEPRASASPVASASASTSASAASSSAPGTSSPAPAGSTL